MASPELRKLPGRRFIRFHVGGIPKFAITNPHNYNYFYALQRCLPKKGRSDG